MFTIQNNFKIEIPNVEIEDDQTFIVGIVFGVSRWAKSIECNFPIYFLIVNWKLIGLLHFLQMLANGDIGHQSIDIVLGILKKLWLLGQFWLHYYVAFADYSWQQLPFFLLFGFILNIPNLYIPDWM